MAILKIAQLGHPILQKKASLVEDIKSIEIRKLINDMSETMIEYDGIGLAAPQVHVNKQILIYRNLETQEENNQKIEIRVLINPKINKASDETENDWEGCLSIPGMSGLVKRYKNISYEAYDITGKLIKSNASNLEARIIQHEFDHLMGIVYTNKLVDVRAFGYSKEIEKYWKEKK